MNGVDLSRQMAKNQDLFRDTIKKNNEANEKRISDLKNQHEYVQKKQLDTFVKDKNAMEDKYESHFENMGQKTRDTLNANLADYNQKIREERENFAKETENRTKDFDDRLKEIKTNYSKSLDSEKQRNKEVETTQKKVFDSSIAENKKDSNERLGAFREKIQSSGVDLKDQYNKERRQMTEAYDENLKNTLRDAAYKREELKERIGEDIRKTREVAATDLSHTKKHSEERINSIEKDYQDQFRNMAYNYANRNADVVKKQQEENRRLTRENQDQVLHLQRSFDGKLRDMKLEEKRRDNGSGEFAQIMKDQKGFNDRIRFEKQLKNVSNNLEEKDQAFNEQSLKELEGYKRTLREQKKEAAAAIEKRSIEVNADKLSTIAKEKEKNIKHLENVEYQNHLEKAGLQKQIISEREMATDKYEHLQANFAKSLKEIEENNKKNFEDLTKVTQKDKSEYIKKIQEVRSQEIFSLKREFNKMMDATVEDYDKKLDDLKRENEFLKLSMEKRLESVIDESEKKIQAEKKMFEERRAADAKAMVSLQDQRDFEYKKKLNMLTDNHQKKMDKMQINNDTQLKFITNDYENKLKELRNNQLKILTDKDANHKIEMDRAKQAYEAEKYGLVSSYENQIAEIRKSYQNQIQELKAFNKLS